MVMRVGSLFSGVGGLELGLGWALDAAGLDHEVAWQVEINPFCRSVLENHWPDAERYEDVTQVGSGSLSPVDCIVGGFPCQDVSSAGAGKGLAGERSGLWFEFARIVRELRPEWVVVENVTSGAVRWVDAVRDGLEQLGYETLPIPLSAADVGAPHLRRRIFVVAHTVGVELRQQPGRGGGQGRQGAAEPGIAGSAGEAPDADGGGCQSIGEPAEEGVERQAGREPYRRGGARPQDQREARGAPADAGSEGLQRPDATQRPEPRAGAPECPWANGPHPEPTLRGLDDGIPPGVVRRRGGARRRCLVALGNSVVPQCAEVVGWVIVELMRRSHAA